ncbi:MAG: 23S rRNA (adenine(2030)-N(6))-methyltransferase RlmJ [Treponema sp.]|nr:23S rRNA (adenine(2030)-N(6))-methyltransferase RlmJ [Treponema sp.]
MLSYRHAFHAGNAQDVIKHAVLAFCLDYLGRKEKPCLLVDTHAGAGAYALNQGYAAQSGEWKGGIGKLLALGEGLPALAEAYLGLAGFLGPDWRPVPEGAGAEKPGNPRGRAKLPEASAIQAYPGSPALMAKSLRPGDRLVCFEKHPEDYLSLRRLLEGVPGAEARREDGFKGLRSLLPPPSRRALVLIDPSYELKEDYRILPAVLEDALGRFPAGTCLVWYPLLGAYRASEEMPGRLMQLYRGNRCRLELYTSPDKRPREGSPRGMYGSGMVIYNPPWTLRTALETGLPAFAAALGAGPRAWMLQWEEAPRNPGSGKGSI